jgi:hypothetical protein
MIPLFAAAEIAYDQVFSTRRTDGGTPSLDELDLVALALSVRLPIYGLRTNGRAAAPISEDELMEGMFWGGATRFELGNGHATVTQLAVRLSDLERVMAELRSRPLEL